MDDPDASAAVREQILALTYRCPKGEYVPDCPFGILAGLSHESRRSTLARMNRVELLALFDHSATCVCPADLRFPPERRAR